MGKVTILDETCKNPYLLIGQCAGIAYDSDITDEAKCVKRGKRCVADGHGRVLEFVDVFMQIEGYSCRVIREFMRHVGDGLTVIQRSTRYVNEGNFEYYTPPAVEKNDMAKELYERTMHFIEVNYQKMIDEYGIKKEDAANLLPLGLNTTLAVKKNARCLMDMSRVRLCNRAYIEYRELMHDIINALKVYSPEWEELANDIFKAKCEISDYCDESMGCGKYPKREEK